MAKSKPSEDVPKAMQEKFNSIVALTDAFAQKHLNQEYAQLIRQATAQLCRKRPSPIEKGQAKTWAAGITHAIGMVNFLYDPSQTPHISASELYQGFGVSASSGQAKSKLVRDTLDMMQMDPDWCLPSRMDDNPMTWLLSVNGFLMDIRRAPLSAQIEAYTRGLIPYIPGHQEDSEEFLATLQASIPQVIPARKSAKTNAKSRKATANQSAAGLQSLYVLAVVLFDGPVTEEFLEENPDIVRTIEIRGDQTLVDLHKIIFQAFDREEEHFYEFQLKGEGPNDPDADRYGLAMAIQTDLDEPMAGDVAKTKIGTLELQVDESFGYWFDFGDDWWHEIQVIDITEPQPKVKYPRITQRLGESPPQYADF